MYLLYDLRAAVLVFSCSLIIAKRDEQNGCPVPLLQLL